MRVIGWPSGVACALVQVVAGLGMRSVEVPAVPARRVIALARQGMAAKAPKLAGHPYERKLATVRAVGGAGHRQCPVAVGSRARLAAAVAGVAEMIPPPAADTHGQWRAQVVERFATVRPFVRL